MFWVASISMRMLALTLAKCRSTGTVKKLKRYAPLLRHLARVKASIRIEMDATQNNYEHHQRKRNVR